MKTSGTHSVKLFSRATTFSGQLEAIHATKNSPPKFSPKLCHFLT